jgi:hypothetical protein
MDHCEHWAGLLIQISEPTAIFILTLYRSAIWWHPIKLLDFYGQCMYNVARNIVSAFESNESRGQSYKTFYGRNLRILIISWSVCLWQAFPT